jgi:5-methylcytosine-specific restriction endonuclease McrA
MNKERCNARTRSGKKCWRDAVDGSSVCQTHLSRRKSQQQKQSRYTAYKPSVFLGERTVQRWQYRQYLESAEWKKKSDELKRDNPNCSLCNRKISLRAHHRTYVRCGNEAVYDLTVLCSECHEMFHNHYDYDDAAGCFIPKSEMERRKQTVVDVAVMLGGKPRK